MLLGLPTPVGEEILEAAPSHTRRQNVALGDICVMPTQSAYQVMWDPIG